MNDRQQFIDTSVPTPTRRSLLRGLVAVGAAGTLAGCLGGDSDDTGAATPTASATATPAPPATDAGSQASFDCAEVPSTLAAFDAPDVEFTFAFDAPTAPDYGYMGGEDGVERVAAFYFDQDGPGSINDWDFYVDVLETVDTYGDTSSTYPNAVEESVLGFDGAEVPVRHQAITDDHDIWVLGLPEGDAFRFVQVGASVIPGAFGCHEDVRRVARAVVASIRPR